MTADFFFGGCCCDGGGGWREVDLTGSSRLFFSILATELLFEDPDPPPLAARKLRGWREGREKKGGGKAPLIQGGGCQRERSA